MSDVSVSRSRVGLLILAVLFLGPSIAAWFAYQSGWRPGSETAHGLLLNPARPGPELALTGLDGSDLPDNLLRREWTLLYIGAAECGQPCQTTLYNMRQVWKSLGRRAERVQGVFLLTGQGDSAGLAAFLAAEHAGLTVARPLPGQDGNWLDFFSLDGGIEPLEDHNIYLLDPLGNWVLVYHPDDPPKGLLKDLKKLLRLSQIG